MHMNQRQSKTSKFLSGKGMAVFWMACWCVFGVRVAPATAQELNENCIVAVLNRTIPVQPDGVWVLPNIPANVGQVRARATCVENGVTQAGQSDFFIIPANGSITLPAILLGQMDPIPASLALNPPTPILTAPGATLPLTATAIYSDSSTADVTLAIDGTNYTSSNPGIATVNSNGLVTAVASGTVLISALNDGALALLQVQVMLSGDSDGDGIPDDQEIALGLNPNDPIDGLEDVDQDGLTAAEEVAMGTNVLVADSDGDGILDGEEVTVGADGFVTNPLLPDTDGDGVRDALEIATGSDPTDPNSLNLGAALDSLQVSPPAFTLTFDLLLGDSSEQLTVTGLLQDQTTIDLTATTRGTNYTSNDLTICNFGAMDGLVFAGLSGSCTITVSNSGFTRVVDGLIQSFAPTALSFVDLPGRAQAVEVHQDLAYVANKDGGLQIVDVANRQTPSIIGHYPTAGFLKSVQPMGSLLYLVEGAGGPTIGPRLEVVDVSDPTTPTFVGEVLLPGNPRKVVLSGPFAYVAMLEEGMQIIDISTPTAPRLLGKVDSDDRAFGVAVDPVRQLAVVANGIMGLQIIDISNSSQPVVLSNCEILGESRKVVLQGSLAFVADASAGFSVVDLVDPSNPLLRGGIPFAAGALRDVAVGGHFAFGAEFRFFNNSVPIIEVSDPASPALRFGVDFGGLGSAFATGVMVDRAYVYLTANSLFPTTTRLYLGQYLSESDSNGVAPTVVMATPLAGQVITEGSRLPIRVEAIDDKSIRAVEFLVNGQVAFTDTTFPYQYDAPVAVGTTALTLAARANDLGGNQAQTDDITVSVQPDPLTTVIGIVVDPSGIPVSGAQVITAGGISGTTAADGTFTLANVPTLFDSSASVTATINGEVFQGTSALVPTLPQGITDVGQLMVILPQPYGDVDEDEVEDLGNSGPQ